LPDVQMSMGHEASSATERYTHVAKSEISKFKKPIGNIFNNST